MSWWDPHAVTLQSLVKAYLPTKPDTKNLKNQLAIRLFERLQFKV